MLADWKDREDEVTKAYEELKQNLMLMFSTWDNSDLYKAYHSAANSFELIYQYNLSRVKEGQDPEDYKYLPLILDEVEEALGIKFRDWQRK